VVPPRGRSLPGIVLSVLLIGAGTVGLLHAAGVLSVSVSVFLAGALIFTGVALVVSAWTGGTSGLIAIGVVLAIALSIATVVRAPLSGGVGDQHWVPNSPEEVRTYYKHGGGDVLIDLSHVTFPAEGQPVRARLGVGHLKVVVPAQARTTVAAHTGVGDIDLFGRHEGGIDVDSAAATGSGEGGTVHLRLEVGAGQIEVVRSFSVVNPPFPPVVPNPPTPIEPPTAPSTPTTPTTGALR
jgi:predicted membrane protein